MASATKRQNTSIITYLSTQNSQKEKENSKRIDIITVYQVGTYRLVWIPGFCVSLLDV